MNQREKDVFVITLIGFVICLIPTILYITKCIDKELFYLLNHIGEGVLMLALGINVRTLVRSNWLQNNFKLKTILAVLYTNTLLFFWGVSDYLSTTQCSGYTKYHSVTPLFIIYFCFSIIGSAVIIIYLLKKNKKLNSHPA
ncbi:MAG: hypothetical protein PHE49_10570 [bacterium]|nr:hypothetical protein [bacterium]